MNKSVTIALMSVLLSVAALTSCSDDAILDGFPAEDNGVNTAFQWTRAEDVETRKAFLRNFGVGYSYNAVRGNYCDWRDIRCQVVNRGELEHLSSLGEEMWGSREQNSIISESKVNYSQRDYVQTMDLSTKESLNLGLYKETTRTRQYVLEEGLQDVFYYSLEDRIVKGEQFILAPIIMHQVYDEFNDELLTQSFQDAVNHLAYAADDDFAVLDSFVNVWGTHVITRAILGASMRLDIKNYMWRYTDNVQEEAYTQKELLGAYNKRKESREQEENYKWIENCSLNLSVKGGDQTTLGNLIGEAHYDGTRDFNLEDIEKWRMSVVFDPTDENASNVEMISMEVVPIWDFVMYEHVARRLKAHIMQDATLQQEMLGERNFFNTYFPIRYPEATAYYQQSTGKWATFTRTDSEAKPMVVNIVSGGRYVATVCHEKLMGQDIWVCYPIYEGKVKLACGLGVTADGWVYQVRWLNGVARLSRIENLDDAAVNGMFYINGGAVSVQPQEGLVYGEANAIPYVVTAGGVQPDGGYNIPAVYDVMKNDTVFSFTTPKDAVTTVYQNWKADDSAANGQRQYKRLPEYIYIYNPTELTYE